MYKNGGRRTAYYQKGRGMHSSRVAASYQDTLKDGLFQLEDILNRRQEELLTSKKKF